MTWLVFTLSIIGVLLNIAKKKQGFLFWAVANVLWAVIDFSHGLALQGILFIIYTIFSIYGYMKWKADEEEEKWWG
jgi:nicotinamide riboside transporter PnuC